LTWVGRKRLVWTFSKLVKTLVTIKENMMLIRNSLLSLVRTKGKTFLFTLLIVALTLTLSLGVCVWASIQQFLDEADEFYTTIGLVEYIGRDYPQDTFIDQEMAEDLLDLDISGIESDPAACFGDGSARYYGFIDGFWRDDDFMSGQNNALIVGQQRHLQ